MPPHLGEAGRRQANLPLHLFEIVCRLDTPVGEAPERPLGSEPGGRFLQGRQGRLGLLNGRRLNVQQLQRFRRREGTDDVGDATDGGFGAGNEEAKEGGNFRAGADDPGEPANGRGNIFQALHQDRVLGNEIAKGHLQVRDRIVNEHRGRLERFRGFLGPTAQFFLHLGRKLGQKRRHVQAGFQHLAEFRGRHPHGAGGNLKGAGQALAELPPQLFTLRPCPWRSSARWHSRRRWFARSRGPGCARHW